MATINQAFRKIRFFSTHPRGLADFVLEGAMAKQHIQTLFEVDHPEPKQRAKRRQIMHVIDAGETGFESNGNHSVRLKCDKCGHETEWIEVATATEGRRGKPCPQCAG